MTGCPYLNQLVLVRIRLLSSSLMYIKIFKPMLVCTLISDLWLGAEALENLANTEHFLTQSRCIRWVRWTLLTLDFDTEKYRISEKQQSFTHSQEVKAERRRMRLLEPPTGAAESGICFSLLKQTLLDLPCVLGISRKRWQGRSQLGLTGYYISPLCRSVLQSSCLYTSPRQGSTLSLWSFFYNFFL